MIDPNAAVKLCKMLGIIELSETDKSIVVTFRSEKCEVEITSPINYSRGLGFYETIDELHRVRNIYNRSVARWAEDNL